MDRQELGNILKDHRIKNKVLVKRICAKMEVVPVVPYRIETGAHNYNLELWISYMEAIGVIAVISHDDSSTYIDTPDKALELMKAIRISQDVSQRELGKMLGISFVTVANYERGHTRVTIDMFLAVINAFGYELKIIDRDELIDKKEV